MQIILSYYYELLDRMQKWYWTRKNRKSRVNGIFLMYHHISNINNNENEDCHHTISEFIGSLKKVEDDGYRFVTIKEALDIIKLKSPQKFAVVTFDDVPKNAYTYAVPFLEQNNIPYVFFITTGFLGLNGYLTEEELLNLDKSPLCTIGSHTSSHYALRQVKDCYKELSYSKLYLENLLGHPISYLAYPYGRYSSVSCNVIRQAKKAGYICALGSIFAPITDVSARRMFFLPRIVVK